MKELVRNWISCNVWLVGRSVVVTVTRVSLHGYDHTAPALYVDSKFRADASVKKKGKKGKETTLRHHLGKEVLTEDL